MSILIRQAFDRWREVRAEYEDLKLSAYLAADEATRGRMLNKRGERAGIDSYSLFSGPEVRAHAYASPELIEWWQAHPRVTFAEFERQMSELAA